MNPERKQMWLDALRGGEFVQGRSMLKNSSDEYCCLGVACEVYRLQTGLGEWKYIPRRWYGELRWMFVVSPLTARWSSLPLEVAEWYGVWSDPSAIDEDGEYTTLSALNDSGKSFLDIADLIERQPLK